MTFESQIAVKPKWRGVLHQWSFFASIPAGGALIMYAPSGTATWTASIFAVSVMILLGVSALYHRVQWSTHARAWMRRLDHASIYILVSGTYTPVMVHCLQPEKYKIVLALVWGISIAGIFAELVVKRIPKILLAALYIGLGWIAVGVISDITAALEPAAMILLAAGGILYTVGGVIYALKRPNFSPSVFGYHEVFHTLVVIAIICHYTVTAFYLR